MNERIQELWDLSRNGSGRGHDEQKFAELIIQECIDCVLWVGKINEAQAFPGATAMTIIKRINRKLKDEK